ncbi:MAG: single-stranded DNA-binding protein [Candidatus Thorarchaeota archaeon]|jgi:single-strand DNA-binding protein
MAAKLTLVGNLGADPEMRYTPAGKAVTNFNIATNRQWTDADGNKQKETTWWRISVWGKMAEVANQYLKKGQPVYIEGRLRAEPTVYERKDGSWATSYEVTSERFEFVSGAGDASTQSDSYDSSSTPEPEDIPF